MRIAFTVLFLAVICLAGCSGQSKSGSQRDKQEPGGDQPGYRALVGTELDALDVETLKKKEGEQVVVKGKVYSTHMAQSGKAFTLNLGPNWKTCTKAVVFKDDFEKWKGGADGIQRSFEGKVVVIEGKIKLYQGSPEVVVNTPSQIELVREGSK